MSSYNIKNPNGSLVFVRGVRVRPHENKTANLDSTTANELAKYGVHLTPASKKAKLVAGLPKISPPKTATSKPTSPSIVQAVEEIVVVATPVIVEETLVVDEITSIEVPHVDADTSSKFEEELTKISEFVAELTEENTSSTIESTGEIPSQTSPSLEEEIETSLEDLVVEESSSEDELTPRKRGRPKKKKSETTESDS